MIILGIDPGSVITGYAVIKKQAGPSGRPDECLKVIDFGCIITDKFCTTGERLKKIYKEVTKLIEKHKPGIMSIEKLFFFKNLGDVFYEFAFFNSHRSLVGHIGVTKTG